MSGLTMRATKIETPCIRLCKMHPDRGFCEGCGRTLAEIGDWLTLSDHQRRAVMDSLPARLATMAAAT